VEVIMHLRFPCWLFIVFTEKFVASEEGPCPTEPFICILSKALRAAYTVKTLAYIVPTHS
jgi:hypothetical protein